MTTARSAAVRRLPACVVLALPAAFLVACTSTGPDDAATSAVTTTTAAGATTSPGTSTPGTPTATTSSSTATGPRTTSSSAAPGIIPCTPTVSDLSVEGGLAAVGQTGFLVHITNASREPCLTIGYPGVDLLDADGRTLLHATRALRGHLGGLSSGSTPPQLRLEPGDEATTVIEGADSAGSSACVTAAAIRFTLPDNTDSTVLRVAFTACGEVQVHPLLPGATGSA